MSTKMNASQLADIIESFLDGTCDPWDWDDLAVAKIRDPKLAEIRDQAVNIDQVYPPKESGQFCSPEGILLLRELVKKLRGL